MPLYSFHCSKCSKDFELLIGFDEKPVCPTCKSRKVERLMSRVAAPGKSRSFAKAMRTQAAREGHLSNYSRSERQR